MPAKINLLNQQIGKLKVIREMSGRRNGSVLWECECECGKLVQYSTKDLRSDGIIQCRECGTNREPHSKLLENIIGEKFNHLTVKEKTSMRKSGKILYLCECDCDRGKNIYATRTSLVNGLVKSCGCSRLRYQIGEIINNREIIGFDGVNKSGRFYYNCKCLYCNREYLSLSQTLNTSTSCGCQRSVGEFNIIKVLEDNNINYKREYCFINSRYRFDFAILNNDGEIIRLIEFDGEQHYQKNIKNNGWNTEEHYNNTFQRDNNKNLLAKQYKIPLVRIPYWERDKITIEIILGEKYLIS